MTRPRPVPAVRGKLQRRRALIIVGRFCRLLVQGLVAAAVTAAISIYANITLLGFISLGIFIFITVLIEGLIINPLRNWRRGRAWNTPPDKMLVRPMRIDRFFEQLGDEHTSDQLHIRKKEDEQ